MRAKNSFFRSEKLKFVQKILLTKENGKTADTMFQYYN